LPAAAMPAPCVPWMSLPASPSSSIDALY